jgi:Carboxypeptidase regulatory-like domain
MHTTAPRCVVIAHLVAAIAAVVLVTGCATSPTPAVVSRPAPTPVGTLVAAAPGSATASATPAPTTAASANAPPPGDATDFTVTGTVDTSPACPGPVSAGSPCPDRPLAGATIEAMRGTTIVATTHTDPAGHYRLTLHRGTYRLTATGTTGYRSHAARTITVPPDLAVDLTIDSGMR